MAVLEYAEIKVNAFVVVVIELCPTIVGIGSGVATGGHASGMQH